MYVWGFGFDFSREGNKIKEQNDIKFMFLGRGRKRCSFRIVKIMVFYEVFYFYYYVLVVSFQLFKGGVEFQQCEQIDNILKYKQNILIFFYSCLVSYVVKIRSWRIYVIVR